MKKLMMCALVATAVVGSMGCVGTYISKKTDGSIKGYRLAILYPFDVEGLRFQTTNCVVELKNYKSEGANSNTVAFASETVKNVAEGVAEGVTKGLK